MPEWSTSTIPTPLSTEAVTNGRICLYTPATTHLIFDLNGYYTAAKLVGHRDSRRGPTLTVSTTVSV